MPNVSILPYCPFALCTFSTQKALDVYLNITQNCLPSVWTFKTNLLRVTIAREISGR